MNTVFLFLVATIVAGPIVRVDEVVDGDTFRTSNAEVVHIRGLDAPELDDPNGRAAQAVLLQLILDRKVTLTEVAPIDGGGFVANVKWRTWDIGYTMLHKGFAATDETTLSADRLARYQAKVAESREARRGMWSTAAVESLVAPAGDLDALVAEPAPVASVPTVTAAPRTQRVIVTSPRGLVPLFYRPNSPGVP